MESFSHGLLLPRRAASLKLILELLAMDRAAAMLLMMKGRCTRLNDGMSTYAIAGVGH